MTRDTPTLLELFGSKKTTVVLTALMLMWIAVGMAVPQGVPWETISLTYSASFTQVVRGFGLHDVLASWPFQLTALLLVLSLAARLILEGVPTSPNLRHVGVVLAACAIGVLAVASMMARGEQRGRVFVMPGTDDAARARFRARKQVGDKYMPWRPDFNLACELGDGTALSTRQCMLTIAGSPYKATLQPRRDLEFEGLRLTWVGVRTVSGVGGLELEVTGPSGRSTSTASVGTPLDVNDRDQVIATLLLLGNAPGDPVGVLPAGPSAPPLTLSARPRYLLELHVSGTKHERWVWIGAWMLLLAALLAVLGGDSKLRLAREGTA